MATATSTPFIAAIIAESPASATPLPPTPVPTGEREIAGTQAPDPKPFVLFGAVLFALAAAAGQVLRNDPLFFRRVVDGFDGVRRVLGQRDAAAGGTSPAESETLMHAAAPPDQMMTLGGQPANGLGGYDGGLDDIAKIMTNGLDSAGKSAATLDGFDAGRSAQYGYDSAGHTVPGDLHSMANAPTSSLDSIGKGAANFLDSMANATPNGLDSIGKAAPGGFDATGMGGSDAGFGHLTAADAASGGDFHADALGQAARPTDWGTYIGSGTEAPPQFPDGSMGGGGNAAKAAHVPGSEVAHVPGGEVAHSGLGGHGTASGDAIGKGAAGAGNGLARAGHGTGVIGLDTVGPDFAGLADALAQAGYGTDAGISGPDTAGPDFAGLSDALAQRPAPPATVIDLSTVVGPETDGAKSATASSAWLVVGALARAASQTPLPRTVVCPSCARSLPWGRHRFCGYCGDPLDKTLS